MPERMSERLSGIMSENMSLQTWFLAWSLGIMGRELGKVPLKNLHIRSGQMVAVEEATRRWRKTRKEEEEMRLT